MKKNAPCHSKFGKERSKAEEVEHHYQILNTLKSLSTKSQLKLTILDVWTKNHYQVLHIQISPSSKF